MNVDFSNDKYLISLDRAEYTDLVFMLDYWRHSILKDDTFCLDENVECSNISEYKEMLNEFSSPMFDVLERMDSISRHIVYPHLY